MLKDFFGLAFNLIPPEGDSGPIYKYHITLSLWIFLMAAGISIHIALACGFVPVLYPGFATAGQWNTQEVLLARQQAQINRLEQTSLGSQLFTMREKQCKAPTGAKDVYTTQLNALYENYMSLTKQAPRLPGCEEF